MNLKKTVLKIYFLPLLLCAVMLCSCMSGVPDAREAEPTVIFTYLDENSLPAVRLSVFAESADDARHYGQIELTAENGYAWTADEPVVFSDAERMYVGYTNFVPPASGTLPTGEYRLVFRTFSGEEEEFTVLVEYAPELCNMNSEAFSAYMAEKEASKSIIIYSNEDKVIYFGPRTEDLGSIRKIWNKYSSAAWFQEIWRYDDIMCILPVVRVEPGQD